jgi:hypothetical protein
VVVKTGSDGILKGTGDIAVVDFTASPTAEADLHLPLRHTPPTRPKQPTSTCSTV